MARSYKACGPRLFVGAPSGAMLFVHRTEKHRGNGLLLRGCARSVVLPQHVEPYPRPGTAVGQGGELVFARFGEVLLE